MNIKAQWIGMESLDPHYLLLDIRSVNGARLRFPAPLPPVITPSTQITHETWGPHLGQGFCSTGQNFVTHIFVYDINTG